MKSENNEKLALHPLVVDLDFSLLATDVTYESILLTLKKAPWTILQMPFWYARGKVAFKTELCSRVQPEAASLPVNQEVVDFVRTERSRGRRTILATASMLRIAQPIAEHLNVFDDVIATVDGPNLGGSNKVEAIRALIGTQDFDYIGDRSADLPIWKACTNAIAVNPAGRLEQSLGRPFFKVFHTPKASFATYLKCIRIHQWLKNLLLFVPIILAHQLGSFDKLSAVFQAFFAFSFCASGVYVLNDLMDLEADRHHPRKRMRPMASGKIPVHKGALLVPLLFGLAMALAFSLHSRFVLALLFYVVLTTAYSFWLKRVPLVDVFVLAGLYAYRVLCGSIAASVGISTWMLAFSMFMFLSLAFVKRYSELLVLIDDQKEHTKGRGYRTSDADLIRSVGTASAYLAVLVMALYISSQDVLRLYPHAARLWLMVPIILFWVTRVWMIAHRGEMRDDPVVFAMEDKTSYGVALLCALITIAATLNIDLPL